MAIVEPANGRYGPAVPLTVLISGTLLLATLFGAGWTLFQTQFSALNAQIKDNKETIERNENQIAAAIDRRTAELTVEQRFLRDRLIEAREIYVGAKEFNQFSGHISDDIKTMRLQLNVLETTRPTTGELQASNRNAVETASQLELRVRALEQYLLGQSRLFAPPQK